MFDWKVTSNRRFDYFLLKCFFYNLLAVIYDKKVFNSYQDKYVRSQMYHIVKDIASSIRMSSENHHSTALSKRVSHLETRRVNTSELGQLTCSTSLWDAMKIARIHRLYSFDVRGWCSDKKEGFLLAVDPFKEKTNQHRTLYLDPQRFGQTQYK